MFSFNSYSIFLDTSEDLTSISIGNIQRTDEELVEFESISATEEQQKMLDQIIDEVMEDMQQPEILFGGG